MAQTPEQKAAKYMIDGLADSRFSEIGFAQRITQQPYDIQARFWNVVVGYVYTMSQRYEFGTFENNTYEIARLCKKVKDFALADEYITDRYAVYGDYEVENNLTDYPMA